MLFMTLENTLVSPLILAAQLSSVLACVRILQIQGCSPSCGLVICHCFVICAIVICHFAPAFLPTSADSVGLRTPEQIRKSEIRTPISPAWYRIISRRTAKRNFSFSQCRYVVPRVRDRHVASQGTEPKMKP